MILRPNTKTTIELSKTWWAIQYGSSYIKVLIISIRILQWIYESQYWQIFVWIYPSQNRYYLLKYNGSKCQYKLHPSKFISKYKKNPWWHKFYVICFKIVNYNLLLNIDFVVLSVVSLKYKA